MLIRNFLATLANRRKLNVRRRLARPHNLLEQLESRTLLTGNVQVSLIGSNAQITGDAANNEIEVVVNNGSVVVRGLNGTTVNQGSTAFTLANASTTFHGGLTASLGAGDDVATIGPGITFAGNVSVSGNGGADSLRARTGTYNGNLSLMGGDGASSIVIDGATVSGNLSVSGQGAMVVSLTNSTVRGQLDVATGLENSADSVVIKGTTVDKKTSIVTGKGDDNVVLQNSHLNGQLSIYTGVGNDVVYIDSSSVGKFALIATQRGNDMLQVLNSSSFSKLLMFAGGLGNDGASIAGDTSTHRVIKGSQKAKYFAPATIASRITAPTTGAIAVADALRNAAVPALTVTTAAATFAENAGTSATTLTVTRTGPTTADLVVTLTSSNSLKATVPGTITILAGQTTATATISAIDNSVSDADAVVTFTAAAAGLVTGTRNVTVTDNEAAALTLTANQTTVSESAGATAVTYTVARNTSDLSQPLTVTLDDGPSGRLTVGTTVVIPANQSSITFNGAAIENTIVDGSTDVVVTATATGFTNGTVTVKVTDNEPATLVVTSNVATIAENAAAGALVYTVSRNTADNSAALTVNVSSGTTRLALASATVTILAGQSSVTFVGTPDNNLLADGNVPAIVTATATGFVTGTASVTVTDNDSELSITAAPGTVSESAAAESVTYTLSRNTVNVAQAPALIVNVSSGTSSRLTVANSTVTIPAGQVSVTFKGSPVPNTAADGNASVVVTASAAGFSNGTAAVTVNDDDSALTVTTTTPTIAENAATGSVKYKVTRNSVDKSQPLTVNIVSQTPTRLTVTSPSVTIPSGAEFIEFTGSPVENTVIDGNAAVLVTAAATGFTSGTVTVTVTDADTMALTATPTTADKVQSNGTIITRNAVTQVTGTTTEGATISIDSNGDGVFDNGTATAAGNGTYSVNVNVTNTSTNHGENRIVVRAVSGANSADTAVSVHRAVGTVVHFATNVGAYDVELLDSEAGATVTNFLSYVTSGAYQNMFVHRANAGSAKFIQGGGFKVSGSQITDVATNAPIANQFNPANGNVAGTLAMALTAASINSGTSGWFVNAIDNSAGFDPGKYTVFGRVIGDGLTVVNEISNLPQANLNTLYSSSALATVPLNAIPANTSITGTVATASGSAILTGTGTLFTSQLTVGESIVLGSGKAFFVSSIQSDTSLTLTQSATSTASGLAVKKHVVPTDAEFVVFSSIGKILDTL